MSLGILEIGLLLFGLCSLIGVRIIEPIMIKKYNERQEMLKQMIEEIEEETNIERT